jgi:alginate O-acetyltransferase complex protein AlgI
MAVGLGLMFGIHIPQNFNSPYKAHDPSDFWRRWHISLSMCLRDYLYISFGGNRHGTWRTYRNLMLTMLIGGLWHGANWTFVIWGAYHGGLLILYRLGAGVWDRLPAPLPQVGTFFAVVIGWVFFRAPDMTVARALLRAMFVPTSGYMFAGAEKYFGVLLIAAVWAVAGPNAFDLFTERRWRPWHGFALATAFGACVAMMAGELNSPFLYFQF